jgi:signal peptidase I
VGAAATAQRYLHAVRSAALAVLLASTVLVGCTSRDAGPEPARRPRDAGAAFLTAIARRDGEIACRAMTPAYARVFAHDLAAVRGVPATSCPQAFEASFAGTSLTPSTSGSRVLVAHGDRATLALAIGGGRVTALVRRGGDGIWRLACCTRSQRTGRRFAYRVPSGSMRPAVLGGEIVLGTRLLAGAAPRVGDVVALHPPAGAADGPCADPASGSGRRRACTRGDRALARTVVLKRIIAGPGDRVALKDGRVVRNGRRIAEPYARPCARATPGCDFPVPVTVRARSWFVLGDDRGASVDSREFGPVPRRGLIGVVDDP